MLHNARAWPHLSAVFAFFAIAAQVAAQPPALTGSFCFQVRGLFDPAIPNSGVALQGVFNLDGAGGLSGSGVFDQAGDQQNPAQISPVTFTGSFAVQPDGTGTLTLAVSEAFSLTFALVTADGGQSMQLGLTRCIQSDGRGCNLAGAVIIGTARTGQNGSLTGSYAFERTTSPFPNRNLGVATFDGAGQLTWTGTTIGPGLDDFSGAPPLSTASFTGTYTTNADGSGTISLTAANGQPGPSFAFVIVDRGAGLLLLQTNRTDSNVSTGTARLQ